GEVVGVDEVAQVGSQLVVGLVEVAFDGRVLDGAVHSFDLPIGPRVLGLCQPMIDVVLGAGVFEGVRPNGSPASRATLMSGDFATDHRSVMKIRLRDFAAGGRTPAGRRPLENGNPRRS